MKWIRNLTLNALAILAIAYLSDRFNWSLGRPFRIGLWFAFGFTVICLIIELFNFKRKSSSQQRASTNPNVLKISIAPVERHGLQTPTATAAPATVKLSAPGETRPRFRRGETIHSFRRTFRIFISSTFSDMKRERDALQNRVFPKLRDLCMRHGCRFQAIDLRWGVSDEAALDQQTVKICLEEIGRCRKVTPRPNFIVLLGDRYGWRPLPSEIPASEFEEIERRIFDDEDKKLLTIWYKRDDNAVPAVYCLLPRTGNYIDCSAWEVVEQRLRAVLLCAISGMDITADQRLKYIASATEQEIAHGALRFSDANEHVYCFFRSIKRLPQDVIARDFIDLDDKGTPDEEARRHLDNLKNRLSSLLPQNTHAYETGWTGETVDTSHIDRLCKEVHDTLSRIILEEIIHLKEIDSLEKEVIDHETFGRERAMFFIGRTAVLQNIADYITGNAPHPLAVVGESGSGKSALIARAVRETSQNHPDAEVIFRFIGATPGSSDGRTLLEQLCLQITRRYGADEATIPAEYKELVREFPKRAALATAEKPLILFLDALDQLSDSDHARSLSWLPLELPQHARVIVSTLPGECCSVLERRVPRANRIPLEPMPIHEGKALLDLWLQDAGRTLQAHQAKQVTDKFTKCGLPLYLKLAFEEARGWKSYTEKTELSADIPGIIRDLFMRLSAESNHGEVLVSRSLGYLAAAKNGLTEDELIDVLSRDKEVVDDFLRRSPKSPAIRQLPVVVWSRLYFDLEPYLAERAADGAALLTFYHRQLGEVVKQVFLSDGTKRQRHEGLAQYFGRLPLWLENDNQRNAHLRKVSELPYQQTNGESWDAMEKTLTDLYFIEAKCAAGMTYDLIADYQLALDRLPEAQKEKQKELEHGSRVKKYVEHLIAYAKREILTFEPIPSVEPWSDEKTRKETEKIINNPTLIDRLKGFLNFINSEQHNLLNFGRQPGFCLQQALRYYTSGPVAETASKLRLDELHKMRKALLFDVEGRNQWNPFPPLLKTIDDHQGRVTEVHITPDGEYAISGSSDNTIRIWDLEIGKCQYQLTSNRGIKAFALTPDAKTAVSGEEDWIQVWDIQAGVCVKTLTWEHHYVSWVNSIDITPDGQWAVSAHRDCLLRIWDITKGRLVKVLEGHTDNIACVRVSSDGCRAVSGSWDRTVKFWDLASGECLKSLKKVGTRPLVFLDATPDLSIVAAAGERTQLENTVRDSVFREFLSSKVHIWDLRKGTLLSTIKTKGEEVTSVSLTADGRVIAIGSESVEKGGSIRTFSLVDGKCIKLFETEGVASISITADGRKAVSAHGRSVMLWDIQCGNSNKTEKSASISLQVLGVTPENDKWVCRNWDNDLWIVDRNTRSCLKKIKHHSDDYRTLCVTPDGRRKVGTKRNFWGGNEPQMYLSKVESSQMVGKLEGHAESVTCIRITPDGQKLVSGSLDKTVRVWDMRNQRCLLVLNGHTKAIKNIIVSPDGKTAVSCSYSALLDKDKMNALRFWDIENGECIGVIDAHQDLLYCMDMSPDGKYIMCGGNDTSIRIWDMESLACKTMENENLGMISDIKVTPDGQKVLALAGRDIVILDIESEECIAIYPTKNVDKIHNLGPGLTFSGIRSTLELPLSVPVSGKLEHMLGLNLPVSVPLVTPRVIWLYAENGEGQWDNDIKTECPWCHQRFKVTEKILGTIHDINRNVNTLPEHSPRISLPREAWDGPSLSSECPLCRKPLRFNPFIVDNRDRL